jgi:hypothetical protein
MPSSYTHSLSALPALPLLQRHRNPADYCKEVQILCMCEGVVGVWALVWSVCSDPSNQPSSQSASACSFVWPFSPRSIHLPTALSFRYSTIMEKQRPKPVLTRNYPSRHSTENNQAKARPGLANSPSPLPWPTTEPQQAGCRLLHNQCH